MTPGLMLPSDPDDTGRHRESRQLIFDLPHEPAYGAADFLVSSSNAEAHAYVDLWPAWPAPVLIITGPPRCGKSHIAAIWSRHADARTIKAGDTLEPVEQAAGQAIVLEDCDRAHHSEAALFHLMNLIRESGGWLVLTARTRPDLWGVALPDLLSRLRLAPTISIGTPDGPLMRAVLVKLFSDRQIRIEEDVVAYAALHLDQSLDEAARFVQTVDDESLAAGRRITKNLASAVIARLRSLDP